MKLTLIPDGKIIGIDGTFYENVQQDLSWIPSNVHAVQWSDSSGEIEYNDGTPNQIISELGIYSQAQTDYNNETQRVAAARDYWEEFPSHDHSRQIAKCLTISSHVCAQSKIRQRQIISLCQ